MAGTELTKVDPLADSGVRNTIERTVAEERVADRIDSVERDRPEASERRTPLRAQRKVIRDAIREHEVVETKERGLDPQGPPAWLQQHPKALAAWGTAHPELRKVFLQQDEVIRNIAGQYSARYGALENVLATHRPAFNSHGLNDLQAVDTVFRWVAALSNPATSRDAFHRLAGAHGINLSDLGVPYGDLIHENQQLKMGLEHVVQTQQSQQDQQAAAEVASWARGKTLTPDLRVAMAHFLQAGANMGRHVSLDEAHEKAMIHLGIPQKQAREVESKRRAAVSPRGSTPVRGSAPRRGKRDRLAFGSAGGVKDQLMAAFREDLNSRGRI
jgi:hypothetical protein